jgi:hypothetical protein
MGPSQPQIVADHPVVVARSPNDWRAPPWIGSPSIARLPSGVLLACHDLFSTGSDHRTSYFLASLDDGRSWEIRSSLSPMFWPSLFQCESGLHVMGVEGSLSGRARGDLVISRSDDEGRTWSPSRNLTQGLAVHTGNCGVLVSHGRVSVSLEMAPSLCAEPPFCELREAVHVQDEDLDARSIQAKVKGGDALIPHTLAELVHGNCRLYARVLEAKPDCLTFLPERWKGLHSHPQSPQNSPGPWSFSKGSRVSVASGTLGSHRDFWVMVMDADEHDDLLCSSSWRHSNCVANPGYTHARTLLELFGINFVPREANGTPSDPILSAWAGWLEGVLVRLEHPGGSGEVLNLMRLACGGTGNLSARLLCRDGEPKPVLRFDRFGIDPGLSCTHCSVCYDSVSELYWMVSNLNRDVHRDISHLRLTGGNATQERSTLGLSYSLNAANWFLAGLIAYSRDWVHSYHYPHFIIDGEDLVVVARAHIDSPLTEGDIHKNGPTADNHNSNALTFHRVRHFRSLANVDFIRYTTGGSTCHKTNSEPSDPGDADKPHA